MISNNNLERMKKADKAWASVLYLFEHHSKLQNYLTDSYFDLDNGFINTDQLLKLSSPWSKSEKFMLRFAIHLFNGETSVNLNDIDYLDSNNKKLVMETLKIRF
ncbi:hypothetical protein NST17_13295 [Caldifermentibacillus hisashii]|uniref:Uncharacterized protein n=1 Tax=Caldifermentibacillus hisashii TaxID=996558 RepID=A0ABU9JZA1_9BACI